LVEVIPAGHVNPLVKLIDAAQKPSNQSGEKVLFCGEKTAYEKSLGTNLQSDVRPPAEMEKPNLGPALQMPTQTPEARLAKAGTPPVESSNEKVATADSQDTTVRNLTRIQTFYKHFFDGKLGPFPRVRETFYSEIERLTSLKKYSANRLPIKAARQVHKSQNLKIPFEVADEFLLRLLSRQPVLLDNDNIERNPLDASSFSIPITGLKEDWKDLLDAELLFFLVAADGRLAVGEMEDIAFVLYPGLDEDERLERLDRLFALLSSTGRMEIVGGIFKAIHKPRQPTPVVVLEKFRQDASVPKSDAQSAGMQTS
jgi:hypothetical protein